MFEKWFHLKEHKTDVKTEILAGVTTFLAMAYILAVNPNILSACGMDRNPRERQCQRMLKLPHNCTHLTC